MRRLLLYWSPLAAYMALILVVSIIPMPEDMPEYRGIDKLYHFGAYLVMGLLWARAVNNGRAGGPRGRVFATAALVTFFFGAFVEVCQSFSAFRSADAIDALANGGGGFIGAIAYGVFKR